MLLCDILIGTSAARASLPRYPGRVLIPPGHAVPLVMCIMSRPGCASRRQAFCVYPLCVTSPTPLVGPELRRGKGAGTGVQGPRKWQAAGAAGACPAKSPFLRVLGTHSLPRVSRAHHHHHPPQHAPSATWPNSGSGCGSSSGRSGSGGVPPRAGTTHLSAPPPTTWRTMEDCCLTMGRAVWSTCTLAPYLLPG